MNQQHKKKEGTEKQPNIPLTPGSVPKNPDPSVTISEPSVTKARPSTPKAEPSTLKAEPSTPKAKPAKERVNQVEQQTRIEGKTGSTKQKGYQPRVNFKGRVGEFRKDALFRSIPIALQRNPYRETVPVQVPYYI